VSHSDFDPPINRTLPRAIQGAELDRVSARIGAVVMQFAKETLADYQGHFRMGDLLGYVAERISVSPDSPSRILRDLRRKGELDYVVTDRAGSAYRIVMVKS
jgi:hypothetical protein